MSKASAIAFIIVLIFVTVAGYMVYTNVRDELHKSGMVAPRDEQPPTTVVASTATDTPEPPTIIVSPTDTETPELLSTPTEVIPTPTPMTKAGPTIRVVTPTIPPTLTPRPGTSTPKLTPTPQPSPSPTMLGKYTFYLDGEVYHDTEISCLAQYIKGVVRDRQGNPLEGVRIKAYDLWGNEVIITSKGGVDIGKWDIVLGPTENIWNVVILDAAGQEISPVAVVPHHQESDFKNACTHIVNWRRAW